MATVAAGRLTNSEAAQLRPDLIKAILAASESADDVLTNTNRMRAEAEIWSTIDENDARVLADALLSLGKQSGIAAAPVRMVARGYISARALMIVAPRVWQTAKWYPEHGGFAL